MPRRTLIDLPVLHRPVLHRPVLQPASRQVVLRAWEQMPLRHSGKTRREQRMLPGQRRRAGGPKADQLNPALRRLIRLRGVRDRESLGRFLTTRRSESSVRGRMVGWVLSRFEMILE